jgi:predicted transcriptional regulator
MVIAGPPFWLYCRITSRSRHTVSDERNAKTTARAVIDSLPDSATWDDVMYELYVREAIDDGLADVQAGRSTPQAEVRTRLRELVRRAS